MTRPSSLRRSLWRLQVRVRVRACCVCVCVNFIQIEWMFICKKMAGAASVEPPARAMPDRYSERPSGRGGRNGMRCQLPRPRAPTTPRFQARRFAGLAAWPLFVSSKTSSKARSSVSTAGMLVQIAQIPHEPPLACSFSVLVAFYNTQQRE